MKMRLGEFISQNIVAIIDEWESFAKSLAPGKMMDKLALRNDAEGILLTLVRDMAEGQTLEQQESKSQGRGGAGGANSERMDNFSSLHAVARVGSGFDLVEMVSEYRALRATVLRLWRASIPAPDREDIADITRFNEGIDQSLAVAVHSYAKRVDETRRMFLAILAHDLRNPLQTIQLSTQVASAGLADASGKNALNRIETSVQSMNRLVSDLMDFATTGLGSAMPLAVEPLSLTLLAQEVLEELRGAHPEHRFVFEGEGDVVLFGDAARLRQVLSNLLGNAAQHGPDGGKITLAIRSEGSEIIVTVHNGGPPMPAALLPILFKPMVRSPGSERKRQGSVGLGLYIVQEIVRAHGGSVEVASSESEGTRFLVRLPVKPRLQDRRDDDDLIAGLAQ